MKQRKIDIILPLVLVPGIILRFFLALTSPGGGGTTILRAWAEHTFFANAPGFTFSHIPLYDRLYSCSPFYAYISYLVFGVQALFRNAFPGLFASPMQGEGILNLFVRMPLIIADLGIALLIYYVLKGKLKDGIKAALGAALYFWLPPLIFAEMRRPFTLPVSVLFLLAAVMMSERRGRIWAAITGLSFSLCFLTDMNPLLLWAVVLWIAVKYMMGGKQGNRHSEGIIVLVVMIAGFFLISAPFHRFTFRPPPLPANLSRMPEQVQENLSKPLSPAQEKMYPLLMIRENQDCFYNSTSVSAFNVWAMKGVGQPDGGNLFLMGKSGVTPGMAGWFVSFLLISVLAVILAMGKMNAGSGIGKEIGVEIGAGKPILKGNRSLETSPAGGMGNRSLEAAPTCFYFALVFLVLFIFPTRGHDYLLLSALPFLILIFFSDIRARILFYGLSVTCWVNLFFSDHFDLSPDAFTSVPAIIRILSGTNILLFIAGAVFFLVTAGEKDETEIRSDGVSLPVDTGSGAKGFEARLFTMFPSLGALRDWFSEPGNLFAVLLLLVAFILRMWRLGIPGEINFDEEYYVPIAGDYFYGLNDTVFDASHPPFATYIIGIGIGLLGDNVFGWRIMSVFFSVMQIGILYLFAKTLFKNHIPALFAAFLLTFDFLHFVHSRLGMLDMFSSFFNLLSYYLFYLYMEDEGDYFMWCTGVSLALGAACKWTSLFAVAGIMSIIAGAWISSAITKKQFPFADKLRSVNPLKVAAALLIIPFLFQVLSFMPLLGSPGASLDKIRDMMHYHKTLAGSDEISSPWWSWIFAVNPINYMQAEDGPPEIIEESGNTSVNRSNRQVQGKTAVMGMGNPLVWWLSIPAFIICMLLSYRESNPGGIYACMPFIFQYLPWAFADRITYLFYMTDIVPYICLMVAFCLYKLHERGRTGRFIVMGYLTAVAVSFFIFYPIMASWFVSPEVFERLRIFNFPCFSALP